jgi:hypothetical protein
VRQVAPGRFEAPCWQAGNVLAERVCSLVTDVNTCLASGTFGSQERCCSTAFRSVGFTSCKLIRTAVLGQVNGTNGTLPTPASPSPSPSPSPVVVLAEAKAKAKASPPLPAKGKASPSPSPSPAAKSKAAEPTPSAAAKASPPATRCYRKGNTSPFQSCDTLDICNGAGEPPLQPSPARQLRRLPCAALPPALLRPLRRQGSQRQGGPSHRGGPPTHPSSACLCADNEYLSFAGCCQKAWKRPASEPLVGDGVNDTRCYPDTGVVYSKSGVCYFPASNPIDPRCYNTTLTDVCWSGKAFADQEDCCKKSFGRPCSKDSPAAASKAAPPAAKKGPAAKSPPPPLVVKGKPASSSSSKPAPPAKKGL